MSVAAAVLALLAERAPLHPRELIAALPQFGESHVREELHQMLRAGLIWITDDGRWRGADRHVSNRAEMTEEKQSLGSHDIASRLRQDIQDIGLLLTACPTDAACLAAAATKLHEARTLLQSCHATYFFPNHNRDESRL